MKFVHQDVHLIEQAPGLQGIYNAICEAAATCYKAEPKIAESAKAFVNTLIKNGHLAMLEFGTVYLTIPKEEYEDVWNEDKCPYAYDPHTVVEEDEQYYYITTNLRVLVEKNWTKDLECLSEPTKHIRRYAAKFTTSIGIGREFTRHRMFSFAQESTRYCRYSAEKFDGQISFIIPYWSKLQEDEYKAPIRADKTNLKDFTFAYSCYEAEKFYMDLLEAGCTAQEAREVLPLCTKSELCMCGFEGDWCHFFDLRLRGKTGKPHPDAQALASKLWDLFYNRGLSL